MGGSLKGRSDRVKLLSEEKFGQSKVDICRHSIYGQSDDVREEVHRVMM
jgi:hypothetical protein